MDIKSYIIGQATAGGGGGEADLVDLTATSNGTYTHSGHDGYDTVTVNVANSYVAGDEGKVVSNGALVAQTSATKTSNGTYDTTLNNEIVVNVPQGITPTGNINITDMQSTNVANYATAQVVDSDLVAGNIKKDVNILGVTGTYEGGGGSVSNGMIFTMDTSNTEIEEIEIVGGGNDANYTFGAYSLMSDSYAFGNSLKRITFPSGYAFKNHEISQMKFAYLENLREIVNAPSRVEIIRDSAFQNAFSNISSSAPIWTWIRAILKNNNLTEINSNAFGGVAFPNIPLVFSANLDQTFGGVFRDCTGITKVYFKGTPSTNIHYQTFRNCTGITDIYVPWSQSDTINSNAPWGATNATMHYNHTYVDGEENL